MNNLNPKIDTQVYAQCVNSRRILHLGMFYSQIPNLITKEGVDELINKFKFPGVDENGDNYAFDKRQINISLIGDNDSSGLNHFSFFILWNCLRDIFTAFYEGIDKEEDFKKFIENKLGNNDYNSYYQLIRFLRHFFSHNIDEKFRIHSKDIRGFTTAGRSVVIDLNINSHTFNLNGPLIDISILLDFNTITSGDKLLDFITFPQLVKLADFYARLSLDYIHNLTGKELDKHSV